MCIPIRWTMYQNMAVTKEKDLKRWEGRCFLCRGMVYSSGWFTGTCKQAQKAFIFLFIGTNQKYFIKAE